MDGHRVLGHPPLPFPAQVYSLWVKKLCDFDLEESDGSSLVSLSFLFSIRIPSYIVHLVRRLQHCGFILLHSFTFIRDFYGVLDLEPGPPFYGFCTYICLGAVSLGARI